MATPMTRAIPVSQTMGSPRAASGVERPVLAGLLAGCVGDWLMDYSAALRLRNRWRTISAVVLIANVITKSTSPQRNRIR